MKKKELQPIFTTSQISNPQELGSVQGATGTGPVPESQQTAIGTKRVDHTEGVQRPRHKIVYKPQVTFIAE